MGIKRTVSIRLIQLWLLNQWFLLILQRKMQKTKLSNFPLGNPFINLKCFVAILNDWIFGRNFQDILFGSKIMGKNISHNLFLQKPNSEQPYSRILNSFISQWKKKARILLLPKLIKQVREGETCLVVKI